MAKLLLWNTQTPHSLKVSLNTISSQPPFICFSRTFNYVTWSPLADGVVGNSHFLSSHPCCNGWVELNFVCWVCKYVRVSQGDVAQYMTTFSLWALVIHSSPASVPWLVWTCCRAVAALNDDNSVSKVWGLLQASCRSWSRDNQHDMLFIFVFNLFVFRGIQNLFHVYVALSHCLLLVTLSRKETSMLWQQWHSFTLIAVQ